MDLIAEFDNQYYLKMSEKKEIFLYLNAIGIKHEAQGERPPLNISLVIDRSGSMGDRNKLEFVKKAAELIVENLSPSDYLSIVDYDDIVTVLQPSSKLENKSVLKSKIRSLHPRGSTNLSGGMLEGFAQVKSTFKKNYVNRVLLLSDGLANVGETRIEKLQQIVKKKYQDEGIAISTFGVGADFNEELLTNLAEYGRGNYYFIENADQIPEIFQKELSGLLSVVAQNCKLELSFPDNVLSIEKVFGTEHRVKGNKLILDYNDVFSEEEKAALIKFKVNKEPSDDMKFAIRMTYDDVLDNYDRVTEEKDLRVMLTNNSDVFAKGINQEATRNKVLFLANEEFERATRLVDQGKYEEARKVLYDNGVYMEAQFKIIVPDKSLEAQMLNNSGYYKQIDSIEVMSEQDLKIMQKSNKMQNYKLKKKKK